jgi:hypothetical protein
MDLTFLNIQRRSLRRSREDTRSCIIVVFRVKHFEKFEIFGHIVNSNIFTRIFRHSKIQRGSQGDPRRYKMMYNCCFWCQTFRENRNIWRYEFKYLYRIFRHSTAHLDLKDLLELKEFKDLDLLEHSKEIQRRSQVIQDDV